MSDKVSAFVFGVAFAVVVYFAGVAKGETHKPRATLDPLAIDTQLMTPAECMEAIIGKVRRGG